MILVFASLLLLGALAIVGELVTRSGRQREATVRLARDYGASGPAAPSTPLRERTNAVLQERLARLALRVNPKTTIESVGMKLLAAGMARTVSPAGFLTTKSVLAAGGVALGGLLGVAGGAAGSALLLAIVFGSVGFVFPDLVLLTRTKARREQIRSDLPGALDVIAISVEAGLGFDAALIKVGDYMEGPLVEELALTLSEMRIGERRPEALRKLAERVDVAELTSVVQALIQADQLGSPLARILRVQAQDARSRRQLAAEEKAMKAPVKMIIPTAVLIFPSMFIVILGAAFLNLAQLF
jgi:tight adherence protein C